MCLRLRRRKIRMRRERFLGSLAEKQADFRVARGKPKSDEGDLGESQRAMKFDNMGLRVEGDVFFKNFQRIVLTALTQHLL